MKQRLSYFCHSARRLPVLLACALLPFVAAHADELKCPRFPEPKARLQWVAPYMLYNGVPMSIKRFDSEQPPSSILAFYRQAWKGGPVGSEPVETELGGWQTISAVRNNCLFTVQVQKAGNSGSTGLLSATRLDTKPHLINKDKSLPMLYGSTVINDIEHRDDGKNARTVLLSNDFSAEANADFYRRNLGDLGWQQISSFQMNTAKGPGITLVMKRGLEEASLVITRNGQKTTVLANLVDKP